MYTRKSLKFIKYKILNISLHYNEDISNNQFFFFFQSVFLNFSEYVNLKRVLNLSNFLFFRKNKFFYIITEKLDSFVIKQFLELIVCNDEFNYINSSNKKCFKLKVFPVKLKLLFCRWGSVIVVREYIIKFFVFIKINEIFILERYTYILIIKFLMLIYICIYNFRKYFIL